MRRLACAGLVAVGAACLLSRVAIAGERVRDAKGADASWAISGFSIDDTNFQWDIVFPPATAMPGSTTAVDMYFSKSLSNPLWLWMWRFDLAAESPQRVTLPHAVVHGLAAQHGHTGAITNVVPSVLAGNAVYTNVVALEDGVGDTGDSESGFFRIGTLRDSDLDGLSDAMERLLTKTQPHVYDTDMDGLSDFEEQMNVFYDPFNPRTHGAGAMLDGLVVAIGAEDAPFDFSRAADVAHVETLVQDRALDSSAWRLLFQGKRYENGSVVTHSTPVAVNSNAGDPRYAAERVMFIPGRQTVTFTLERVDATQTNANESYKVGFNAYDAHGDTFSHFLPHPDNSPLEGVSPDTSVVKWRFTLPHIELGVDADGNGIINDADMPLGETVGGLVFVNSNDSNANGIADKDESGTVSGETDLMPIQLSLTSVVPNSGTVTLSQTAGAGKIKVWQDSTKGTEVALPKQWNLATDTVPPMLYVEGIAASDAARDVRLALTYTSVNGKQVSAAIAITVAQVDIIYKNRLMADFQPVYPNMLNPRIGVFKNDPLTLVAQLIPADLAFTDVDFVWSGITNRTGRTNAFTVSDNGGEANLTIRTHTAGPVRITERTPSGIGSMVWGALNFTRALTVKNLADEATAWANQNTAMLGGGIHNGRADAARHSYWNALVAQRYNASTATGASTAYEMDNVNDGVSVHNETVMDLENNQTGATIGDAASTKEELPAAIINALDTGALTILNNLGNAQERGLLIKSNQ